MFVVFSLLTIPVYLTGSPASHYMREMSGISLDTIHRHCNAADYAFWTMEGLGALSLFVLYKFRHSADIPPRLTALLLALALMTLGLMIWVANLGGKIRHSEIAARSQFSDSMCFLETTLPLTQPEAWRESIGNMGERKNGRGWDCPPQRRCSGLGSFPPLRP